MFWSTRSTLHWRSLTLIFGTWGTIKCIWKWPLSVLTWGETHRMSDWLIQLWWGLASGRAINKPIWLANRCLRSCLVRSFHCRKNSLGFQPREGALFTLSAIDKPILLANRCLSRWLVHQRPKRENLQQVTSAGISRHLRLVWEMWNRFEAREKGVLFTWGLYPRGNKSSRVLLDKVKTKTTFCEYLLGL